MLKLLEVSKKFGSLNILDSVNLEIQSESITGIVGRSGSGKSSLLRIIAGFEKPDQGKVICSCLIGFIFQDFQLFPHMTVFENISYVLKTVLKLKNYRERAMEILEHLNLDEKINCLPNQLSGGQKQRAALARSLVLNPDLLLCDEPTSGLDINTAGNISELFKKVRKEKNLSLIIASHDLEFLAKTVDRIIMISNGKILLDVKVEQNMNRVMEIFRDAYI